MDAGRLPPHGMAMDALPTHRCPMCGGPNACAPAQSGTLATPCWCRDVTIAAATLERIPAGERQRACLCAACAGVTPAPVR